MKEEKRKKEVAGGWAKQLRPVRDKKEKELATLKKEIGELDFKITLLDEFKREWRENNATTDEDLKKCKDEKEHLQGSRKNKKQKLAELGKEIEFPKKLIEFLEEEYELEDET